MRVTGTALGHEQQDDVETQGEVSGCWALKMSPGEETQNGTTPVHNKHHIQECISSAEQKTEISSGSHKYSHHLQEVLRL